MKTVVRVNYAASNPGTQLGFKADTILVENPTPAYWFLPDQSQYVQPFTTGMVVPALGVERANILFETPPDLEQSRTDSPSQATFTYLDLPLPPNPGLAFGGMTQGGNRTATAIVVTSTTEDVPLRAIADPLMVTLTSWERGYLSIMPYYRVERFPGVFDPFPLRWYKFYLGNPALIPTEFDDQWYPRWNLGRLPAGILLQFHFVSVSGTGGIALRVDY